MWSKPIRTSIASGESSISITDSTSIMPTIFEAAWRCKHRAALGKAHATLADISANTQVSPNTWKHSDNLKDQGKKNLARCKLQTMWTGIAQARKPASRRPQSVRADARLRGEPSRAKVETRFPNIAAGKVSVGLATLHDLEVSNMRLTAGHSIPRNCRSKARRPAPR